MPMTRSVRSGVDEFGDVRTSTDEINRVTNYTDDNMGRLTELVQAEQYAHQSYRYDGLGQHIKHWKPYTARASSTGPIMTRKAG